jgi:Sulfotransferase family
LSPRSADTADTAGDDVRWLQFGFSIAGTQKSGTSSLSALLDEHPQVKRAPKKEMHFFDDERRRWSREDYRSYRVPTRGRHTTVGDATPIYLWWPHALERMHAYNPEMLIIGIFRDPLERLFSQWMMVVNKWPSQALDWPDFITRHDPDGLEERVPPVWKRRGYKMLSGVGRGFYGAQVERAEQIFGRERVHWVEFRAFLADHVGTLDALTDHLGLERFTEHPELPHGMKGKVGVRGTAPVATDLERLAERYRDDLALFRERTGLEVGHWPVQRILDGTLDPAELAATFAAKVVPSTTIGPAERRRKG